MVRFILIVFVVCLQTPCLFSQSTIQDFRPNALGVGYGGSLIVQARDPSAIFWNPALLSGLKYRGMLISVNEPFSFDFIGITQYLPLFGTVGAAFTRMADSTRIVDGGTVAWGRKLFRGASLGANFTMSKQGRNPAASLGFGFFVGNPEIGSLESPLDHQSHTGLLEQVNLGVTVQGLPLSKKLFDPAVLLGLSYLVPGSRLLLNTGYHIRTPTNTFHTGIGVSLSRQFRLFVGTEDLALDAFGVGASYSLQNFWINASYSRTLNQILVSFSARISPKTVDLAAPHYWRGRAYFKSGDEALANSELRKYLSYNLDEAKTDTAASIVRYLELKLTRRRTRIDSLFAQAQRFLEQPKPQTLRAAYNYSKILELDENNLKARIKLTALQPRVDRFIKRWIADGVYEYEAGNYEKAQLQFKKILLFKKENKFALSYLDKIDQFYKNLGQEHFFRGVGFLSNREYKLATEEFNLALKYHPEMADSRRYLKITDQRAKEQADTIRSLLEAAVALERSHKPEEAVKKYKEVLLLDEQNDRVKSEIKRLETNLALQRKELARRKKQAASYFA
ncbi:hypothetical protein MJD09_22035, partial [bacterium]|nr:hypothetical protein [bacterium]